MHANCRISGVVGNEQQLVLDMIRIILVDDHLVVRNGIKLLLDTQEGMQVVAEANNAEELFSYLEKEGPPDLIITDIDMPGMNGIALTQKLTVEYPTIKVIILSMLNDHQNVASAFERGAKGYLVKNVGYDEFLFAVKHVSNGGRYLSEELAMIFMERAMEQSSTLGANDRLREGLDLTERELEVLQLISEGCTNTAIADRLFLSKRTVEGHRQSLIEKTGVKNSASLVKYAVLNGLVS